MRHLRAGHLPEATHHDLQLDLLESGLLTPQKSMLAVFGGATRAMLREEGPSVLLAH